MNWKLTVGIVVAIAGVGAAVLLARHGSAKPGATVTLRVRVAPADQAVFVTQQATSAKFKYLMGRQSGANLQQAQHLSVKTGLEPAILEAQIGVATRDQAQCYVEPFLQTLQVLCGNQVKLTLVDQTIR